MIKRKDLRVRDPYILPHNGQYYLYVTSGATTLSCYTGVDLENWESVGTVFEIPADFWAYKDVWAAEVHPYHGKFYLFVSLLGKNGLRGTQIAVADTPRGPFVPLTDHPVTPAAQSCIDGTLYVENGVPYIVYSHDWPDNYFEERNAYVGEICAQQLSDDLKQAVGEPRVLFASDEVPHSRDNPHPLIWEGRDCIRYGSDAPCLRRLKNGSLFLTWSPFPTDHYVVLGAVSASGSLKGPWKHIDVPLYDQNGGHAMFFKTFDGRDCICFHAPEAPMLERATIFEIEEKDSAVVLTQEVGIRAHDEENSMDLKDKNVLFLGSSVTYGSAAGGVSFADLMAQECGLNCIKEAVSGTTLADIDDGSYVARLKKHGADTAVNLFICQLSTNDATRKLPLAQTEEAIRFIVQYVQNTWGCPIVFYTGTFYRSEAYESMIALLYALQKEYGFHILDLFNDAEMRAVSEADYARFMDDPIHPNLVGYREWWTPKFIAFCKNLF